MRTFALVDHERKPRPASSARAHRACKARSCRRCRRRPASTGCAKVPDGDTIVRRHVVEERCRHAAAHHGVASFHDADGRPMTRPFTLLKVGRTQAARPVRRPRGSKHGTIFMGDAIYPSPEIPSELDPSQFGSAARTVEQAFDRRLDAENNCSACYQASWLARASAMSSNRCTSATRTASAVAIRTSASRRRGVKLGRPPKGPRSSERHKIAARAQADAAGARHDPHHRRARAHAHARCLSGRSGGPRSRLPSARTAASCT